MIFLITIVSLFVSNAISLTYGHFSTQAVSWRALLLMPVIWFPILYVLNVMFSIGFASGTKAHISLPLTALLNIGINVFLIWVANTVIWKQPIHLMQIAGVVLLLIGVTLIILPQAR